MPSREGKCQPLPAACMLTGFSLLTSVNQECSLNIIVSRNHSNGHGGKASTLLLELP